MPRQSGTPKTGGRKAGTPNKATLEVKEVARQYAPAALERLHQIIKSGESDAAKVAASREILDRAYGKPSQAIRADIEQNVNHKSNTESDKEIIQDYLNRRMLDVFTELGFSVSRTKSYEENLQDVKQQLQK